MRPRDRTWSSELLQKLDSLGLAVRGCRQLCMDGEQGQAEVVLMEAGAILELVARAIDDLNDDIDGPHGRQR